MRRCGGISPYGSDNSSGYQPVPFIEASCSHRLWGLPSSSGSPSLLHLGALAPQKHVASSWPRTVEPQPPAFELYTRELDIFASMDFTLVRQPVILHRTRPGSRSLRHLRLVTGVHPTTAYNTACHIMQISEWAAKITRRVIRTAHTKS